MESLYENQILVHALKTIFLGGAAYYGIKFSDYRQFILLFIPATYVLVKSIVLHQDLYGIVLMYMNGLMVIIYAIIFFICISIWNYIAKFGVKHFLLVLYDVLLAAYTWLFPSFDLKLLGHRKKVKNTIRLHQHAIEEHLEESEKKFEIEQKKQDDFERKFYLSRLQEVEEFFKESQEYIEKIANKKIAECKISKDSKAIGFSFDTPLNGSATRHSFKVMTGNDLSYIVTEKIEDIKDKKVLYSNTRNMAVNKLKKTIRREINGIILKEQRGSV